MGRRGPAPKPDVLRELEGNPGKRPLNGSRVRAGGMPAMPDYVLADEYAAAVWEATLTSMPPELYAGCDAQTLAAYCQAASLYRMAAIEFQADPRTAVEGAKGGCVLNPSVNAMQKAASILATLGTRLGLDPAARSSLSAPTDDALSSKFAGLTSIRGGRTG